MNNHQNILILGANGGVAGALLRLIQTNPAAGMLLENTEALYLLDKTEAQSDYAAIPQVRWLKPRRIGSAKSLEQLIRRHAIDLVIDLAGVDTFDCVLACDRAEADYINTGCEVWPEVYERDDERRFLLVRSQDMLPERRPMLSGGSYLLASGMNPGLINALVFAGIEGFAGACGVPADSEALDLYAILYTEIDTTVEHGCAPPAGDLFEMSWNPRHCLEELLELNTGYMYKGELRFLKHPPNGALYRARCGDELIEGMLVPHEEVATVGACFPELEVAYIYRILPRAFRALIDHPRRSPDEWETRCLYPPTTAALSGENRVGVLLCSRSYGEYWIGFRNLVSEGLTYATNATLLQVAAGVIAGWRSLKPRRGVHLVEELDWRRYLKTAEAILGLAERFWDRDAPVAGVEQRRAMHRHQHVDLVRSADLLQHLQQTGA